MAAYSTLLIGTNFIPKGAEAFQIAALWKPGVVFSFIYRASNLVIYLSVTYVFTYNMYAIIKIMCIFNFITTFPVHILGSSQSCVFKCNRHILVVN